MVSISTEKYACLWEYVCFLDINNTKEHLFHIF